MHGRHQPLDIEFETVLILVMTRLHLCFYLCQSRQHIDCRLLVSLRGISEVSERAMELQCGVVVIEKTKGRRSVEGNAKKTFVDIDGIEDSES